MPWTPFRDRPLKTIPLIVLFLLLLTASPEAAGQDASGHGQTKDELGLILEEAAGDLLQAADTFCRDGHLESAGRALDVSVRIVPGSPGSDSIREAIGGRRSAMPRPVNQVFTSRHAKELFNGKTLAGWKKSRGKWNVARSGIVCEAKKSEGYLFLLRPDKECRGFRLSFSFDYEPDGSAGVVLGKAGRNRVGVLFGGSGAALYDFTASRPLGDLSRRKFPPKRSVNVAIRIEMEQTTVTVNDKPVVEGVLSRWEPGTLGLYAAEGALFKNLRLTPLEIDLCLDQAAECLKKRKHARAASLLLRGRNVEKGSFLSAGHLAVTLESLGFRDEAARNAELFLSWYEGRSDRGSRMKQLERAAKAIALRTRESRETLDSRLSAWADRILVAGEAALSTPESRKLDAVVEALEAVDVRLERVEDFRTRVFLSRCGNLPGKELFNGDDLAGWTARAGVWEVVEPAEGEPVGPHAGGILTVMGGEGANLIESDPLPPFDRYVVSLKIRGTGAYINQGVSFFVEGEPWSLEFSRFMTKQEVTISHKGATVLFSHVPGAALTSTRWHDVECIVHINRLTVLLDKKVLFTKVLPAPPEGRIGLFVANDRRGHFDQILYRPLGRLGEYEALLDRIGVTVREVRECETLGQGEVVTAGRVHEQPFAYNGHSLTGVSDPKKTARLTFRFKTVAIDDALLNLRYAAYPRGQQRKEPAGGGDGEESNTLCRMGVAVDGRSLIEPLELKVTGSRNDFTYARLPLGNLSFGWHEIRLEPPPTRSALFLDRIVLSDARSAPTEESKIFDSAAAPHFKIRLSPGVRLPDDSEEIFALLEVVRSYMVAHYGFAPTVTQYYNVIARECWGDPHKGGYATGDNLYIPEETAARNLAVIMHELSHNFDRGMGFNPPWFGEGKSFPIYVKFTRDTRGRYRAHQSPHTKRDMVQGGVAFDNLEVDGDNLLQYWGTPRFPYWQKLPDGRDLTALGYQAANWLCWELSLFLGEGWLIDYFTLLRKDLDDKTFFLPKEREAANSVVVDYFARSSGKDAWSFFKDRRFKLVDLYDWTTVTADCGDDDETYLADGGSSVVEPTPGEGRRDKSRVVREGTITYAFPVPPDTRTLTVEITRSGYGSCHIWDKRIFRGKTPTRAETKTVTLDDPSFWAGSRLKLTFAPDRFGDRALEVAKIVIKKN